MNRKERRAAMLTAMKESPVIVSTWSANSKRAADINCANKQSKFPHFHFYVRYDEDYKLYCVMQTTK